MPQLEVEISPWTNTLKKTLTVSEPPVVGLLFAATFIYLFAFRRVTTMDPDEGIVLQGAERILHGQLPYRDFFTFYTPGSFYLTTLVLKLFGDSLAVARTPLIFFGAIFPVITYVLARRTCSRPVALFVAILVAITTAPYRFLVLHNWDSTFWACLCVYCAVRWFETSRTRYALATGTFAAFTFLCEQSKGAGLCLGLMIAILFFAVAGHKFPRLSALALGFAWPVLTTVSYFAAKHALGPMLEDLVWPFHRYSTANHVRYGDQNWSDHARDLLFHSGPAWLRIVKAITISPGFLVPVLPIVAVGLLFYWATRLRREPISEAAHYVLVCALLVGLLVSVIIVRADIIHFMYLAPLFYLVVAWALNPQSFPGIALQRSRTYLFAYVAVAFGLMGAALFVGAISAQQRIETRRGIVFTRGPETVLQYAIVKTTPDEKILVFPYLPIYYYLSATQSPSKYDYFQPGMSTPQQAGEILQSFKSSQVRTVFWEPAFADKIPNSWPGTPLSAFGYDPITDHIAKNYRVCASAKSAGGWNFLYMRRAGFLCN